MPPPLCRRACHLVRVGGAVVYATCSLQEAQNERVVAAVLAQLSAPGQAAARGWSVAVDPVVSLTYAGDTTPVVLHTAATDSPFLAGGIPGTLRFDPAHSGCGGMFVARLVKVPVPSTAGGAT
jgi:16S rRNA C967 or C1407 C5-methylase (RsmB/RsmF family)